MSKQKCRTRWKTAIAACLFLLSLLPTIAHAEDSSNAQVIRIHAINPLLDWFYHSNHEFEDEKKSFAYQKALALYSVPLDLSSVEGLDVYRTEENRVYCIDIKKGSTFIDERYPSTLESSPRYLETEEVQQRSEELYQLEEGDWDQAASFLAYHERIGGDRTFQQILMWMALHQIEEAQTLYQAQTPEESFAEISEKNAAIHTKSAELNTLLDEYAQFHLCLLRDAIRPNSDQAILRIDAPGTYHFPTLPGYAVPGLEATSLHEGIRLSEASRSVTREMLLEKDDGYDLSFTTTDDLKPGTYEIQVTRPRTRQESEWQYFAANGDPDLRNQWVGRYTTEPDWLIDTFQVIYDPEPPASESEPPCPKPEPPESESEPPEPEPPEPEPKPQESNPSCTVSACRPIAIAIANSPNRIDFSPQSHLSNTVSDENALPQDLSKSEASEEKEESKAGEESEKSMELEDSSEGEEARNESSQKTDKVRGRTRSPKTGDSTRLYLWGSVGVIAALALLWSFLESSRHSRRK